MDVYSEAYLDEVVETQGRLFDKVDMYFPEIDTADFIEKYMTSKTRRYIDEGQAYYQWECGVPSAEVMKILPIEQMERAYAGLHDLELPLAVEKTKESFEQYIP